MEQPLRNDPTEELERLRARVAELERTETRLRETGQQFRALFSQSPIAVACYDADGRVTQANKACLKMFGMPDPSPLQGHSFFDSPNVPEKLKEAVRKGQPGRYEFEYDFAKVKDRNLYPTTRSGIIRLDTLITPIQGEGKDHPQGYLAQMQDVTERLKREAQLDRLNRTLKAQTRSSQVMLHATDELEYLQEVCRIIVQDCGHKLVWIGFAEEDEGKTVRPVAYSGFDEGYIEKLKVTWAATERGRGPAGTAIRTGKPSSCKNILTDPAFAPWRKDALERGYSSLVALPLLSNGRAFGVITIYATEPEVFSEEETKLLLGLADDLAFGIAALRLRTAHKASDENLRESEEMFHTIFDKAPAGILLADTEGQMWEANPAFVEMLGYPASELRRRNVLEITHPDDRQADKESVREQITGRRAPVHVEKRYVRKDGQMVFVRLIRSLCRDAAGKPQFFIGIAEDITARKQAEEALRAAYRELEQRVRDRTAELVKANEGLQAEIAERRRVENALRESEARFRSMFNNAPIGMLVVSHAFCILHANPAFCELLGYPEQELLDKTVEEITHPDDRDATSRNLVQALEGMALPRFEKRYLRKDGETVWGEVSVSLVRDADGTPNYTIGQVLDVTARRQAEEALSASEERYRALFEDAPVGVWEYDCSRLPEHLNQMKQRGITDVRKYLEAHPEEEELCLASLILLDVNRAAVKLTKAGNRNHLIENMPSVSCDEARAYFRMMVAGLVNGENSFEAESALRTLTGEKREVLVSSLFIPGRDGLFRKAVFATADMTELRAAERELTRQKEAVQLQRMETLAATGRLAAGVAHEINNPLQNIVAQLDLLSEELPVKLRKGKRIRLIRDSVEKMATIVKNLLRLHRSPKEDEAFCAAAAVIRSVTDLIMPQATKRQVRVEVSVMPPDATAPLSTVRLTQILLNLVLNALDATPAGGVIQIELDQAPEETLLVVSDTGSGISPEHRSQIFSPFFTTKGPAGTGLGLPVTHSLVTEAGGTIDLADREGGGTTFFVRFAGGRDRRR